MKMLYRMITQNAIIFILVAIVFILLYTGDINLINSYKLKSDWRTFRYRQFYTNLKPISTQPAEPTDIQPVETWEKDMDIVIRTTCSVPITSANTTNGTYQVLKCFGVSTTPKRKWYLM